MTHLSEDGRGFVADKQPRRAPWHRDQGLCAVLDAWRRSGRVSANTVLTDTLPPSDGVLCPIPDTVSPAARAALAKRGITTLFSHQVDALARAQRGESLVIATPTASGKSLCYNLPVLDALARDPQARALYIFPTKALSRDQEEALRGLLHDAHLSHGAVTYDGDTPADARRAARERSGVLITNPDMLHAGILPHHANWARLWADLRYVVLDELHTYRGVFGSHLANVLRRLQRVARFHGASPTFIFASATIGNPAEHATRMLGRDVGLVSHSGAPSGPRHVMVYNPPVVNQELGIRQSYIKAAVKLAKELVRADVATLVFGQSRNTVEVMLKYLRDGLKNDHIPAEAVQAYRGGYLPGTRRRIEAGLRKGEIRCVVATNALELGIDIGSLEAVVCAGYPGSVAALWQRFGRGGRRGGPSLAVLVASSAPLDQYFALNPKALIGAPVEQARIDPDNVEILVQHLKCAAFELPFEQGEGFGDLPAEAVLDVLGFLTEHGVLHRAEGKRGKTVFHWATDAYPANHVSLRRVGWDNFVIIDLKNNRTIAEMDWRATHTMLHEQAIYQHEGEQYQVERLDYDNHKAFVQKVEPDYFTTAMTYVRVNVIDEMQSAPIEPRGGAPAWPMLVGLGEVSVTEKVVGYKKIKFHSHENVGYGEVRLPEIEMHTSAFWITVPSAVVGSIDAPRPEVIDCLRGLLNAMHTVAAVGLMTDPRDLGQALRDQPDSGGLPHGETSALSDFDPVIFLYDNTPGGIGLADRLFEERAELLRRTRGLIEACPCQHGCPGCVGPALGVAAGPLQAPPPSRRRLALQVLSAIGVGLTH